MKHIFILKKKRIRAFIIFEVFFLTTRIIIINPVSVIIPHAPAGRGRGRRLGNPRRDGSGYKEGRSTDDDELP